jgi:hypothetical protein
VLSSESCMLSLREREDKCRRGLYLPSLDGWITWGLSDQGLGRWQVFGLQLKG